MLQEYIMSKLIAASLKDSEIDEEKITDAINDWLDKHPEFGTRIDTDLLVNTINNYLTEHPELMTTIQDGTVDESKLADTLKQKLEEYNQSINNLKTSKVGTDKIVKTLDNLNEGDLIDGEYLADTLTNHKHKLSSLKWFTGTASINIKDYLDTNKPEFIVLVISCNVGPTSQDIRIMKETKIIPRLVYQQDESSIFSLNWFYSSDYYGMATVSLRNGVLSFVNNWSTVKYGTTVIPLDGRYSCNVFVPTPIYENV